MARPLRFLKAPGAFFVFAVLLAGCGNGVPGNAVVRVGDEVIKRSEFNRWMRIAALSSQPPGSGQAVTVPDAPTFAKCIAAKRRSTPQSPPGQPQQTDQALRQQCRAEYEGLRDQVLQFLIQAEWLQGEAKDQDVKVSDKAVQDSFQRQKRQSFPNDADYQRFLRSSGMTQQDILLRVRLDLLTNEIREKVTKGKDRVSAKQIADYYARNKQRFAQPEQRDLQVVLTRNDARAQAAKRALQDGQSWPSVARRFSIDQASKDQGGRLPNVIPGQQEQALDKAVFGARQGQLVGPVRTPFGFYLFRVTGITPGSQQSLPQVRESIRRILQSQNQQNALQKFIAEYQKKWKSRTNCRKGFIIESCRNAPKPRRTSTVPPGAVPAPGAPQQGAPPQGAPPQGAPPQGAPPQGAPPQGAPPQGAPPAQP